jgi:hypothetical protein
MAVVVDPGLLDYMASNSGACTFVLKETSPEAAVRGMQSACRAVGAIPHPEEPGDPLPSYMSVPETTGDGARCTIDVADAEAYEGLLERVLQAVLDGLATEGVISGVLTYPIAEAAMAQAPTGEPHVEPPSPQLPTLPDGTSWSSVGIPLPDPHQPLWRSGSEAGYMLPHDPEFLMTFFEALPWAVASYTANPPDERPYGLVYLAASTMVGSIRVRDAGTARNVEIQLTTDPAKVAEAQAAIATWQFPPGAEIRLDRR